MAFNVLEWVYHPFVKVNVQIPPQKTNRLQVVKKEKHQHQKKMQQSLGFFNVFYIIDSRFSHRSTRRPHSPPITNRFGTSGRRVKPLMALDGCTAPPKKQCNWWWSWTSYLSGLQVIQVGHQIPQKTGLQFFALGRSSICHPPNHPLPRSKMNLNFHNFLQDMPPHCKCNHVPRRITNTRPNMLPVPTPRTWDDVSHKAATPCAPRATPSLICWKLSTRRVTSFAGKRPSIFPLLETPTHWQGKWFPFSHDFLAVTGSVEKLCMDNCAGLSPQLDLKNGGIVHQLSFGSRNKKLPMIENICKSRNFRSFRVYLFWNFDLPQFLWEMRWAMKC